MALKLVRKRIVVYLSLLVAGHTAATARAELPAISRTNLLWCHNRKGQLVPVKSKGAWLKRRAEILQAMEKIMGPLPRPKQRCPLDPKTDREWDEGKFVRRLITYAPEPGARVPAYLLIPKPALQGKKAPGILALHPTDMQYGHLVIVEAKREYYPPYARELAERGFVVLCPAYPLLADYNPDLKGLGYQSGTMKAVWDNIRGLDVLDSLPFVTRGKYGAIGHSLGGHNSIFTAVFDPRIVVIVTSCGFDSFADYMNGNIKGWTSDRYMPALANYSNRVDQVPFDFPELIGALAPRYLFISAPLGDTNFKAASVDSSVRTAAPIYDLYGVPERLQVRHPDCAHQFPETIRAEAFQLLEKVLVPPGGGK